MNEIKKAGDFLYRYNDDKTVTVGKQAVFSDIAAQMLVNEKMKGVAKRTGTFADLVDDGVYCIGVNFHAIPERRLIKALKK